ncbi:chemotaxis protein CheW [Uliginosibacterium sediminicola]|uniref:Chemotaxis protein CheW n=1 Tax=Uliginosibacterium sediminicola TaxID=2024550 RepID=A0ABU9YZY2_9RHOO
MNSTQTAIKSGNAPASSVALASAATHSAQGQYLTFMLGNETLAIGILAIKEIIEYNQLTVVPMMPSTVRGVINLRGAVVPVMDLSARFGKPSTPINKRTCIIIVETHGGPEQQVFGVLVDAVNEVLDIAASDIEPPPSFGSRIHGDFILGMGKVAGRFVTLLNVDRVLSLDELEPVTAEHGEQALSLSA